jgi:hypothetical protein
LKAGPVAEVAPAAFAAGAADHHHPGAICRLDRLIDGGHDATHGFHTLAFHMTLRPGISGSLGKLETLPGWLSGRVCAISAAKRQSMVNKTYLNRVNGW